MDWICRKSEIQGNLPNMYLGELIPEIKYFELSEKTLETLNKLFESSQLGFEEEMAVITDYRDDIEEIREDEDIFIHAISVVTTKKINIKKYIHVEDIPAYNKIQGYIPTTREYKNPINFSIYYTEDEIFIPRTLGEVLKISNIDKLETKLEKENAKTFIKK